MHIIVKFCLAHLSLRIETRLNLGDILRKLQSTSTNDSGDLSQDRANLAIQP